MGSTASRAVTAPTTGGGELSLLRLNILRTVYALIAFAEGSIVFPDLFVHAPDARGVIPSLLSGFCLICVLGLRYPRQMLPLLLFEMAWKYIWFFAFGLPQWLSGQHQATFADDFPAITFGVVLMPFVIPWGYAWRTYVKASGDRWRSSGSAAGIWKRGDHEVSLIRLYVMRAIALLGIWGLLPTVEALVVHAPLDRGVHKALIGGLWLMAVFAFRYPLKMVPILLFEMTWKLLWLLAFGLPQWSAGTGSAQLREDLWAIGAFPMVCALVIPWGYVWRHYVKAPGERWR